jgi:putative membrane protein
MKSSPSRSTAFVLAACLAAGAAWAQSNNTSGNAAKPSKSDVAFLKQAAENGHAEVESGKLALQKAADDAQVRRFAQMMVDDHQKSGEELKALATSKGVEVPAEPSMAQRARIKMLSTADGADFSRRYIEGMGVEAHKETIELFQKAAKGADSADVKAFATKTLPTLQKHMAMAQELHGSHQGAQGAAGERPKSPASTGTR